MTASSIQLLVANTILHGERRDGETRLTLIARPELAEAALEQVNKMTLNGTPKVLKNASYVLRDIVDSSPDLP
jgi:hypothetical protein